jgi:hypothetical protein
MVSDALIPENVDLLMQRPTIISVCIEIKKTKNTDIHKIKCCIWQDWIEMKENADTDIRFWQKSAWRGTNACAT